MTAQLRKFTSVTGNAPTIIIFGPDKSSGDTVASVNAPNSSSEARLSRVGTVSVVVEGAGGVGRSGEPRVVKVLRALLKAEGIESQARSGEDSKGEDGLLSTGGKLYVLQVVTIPQDSSFWREASVGSAAISLDEVQASEVIERSIQLKVKKTPEKERENIILALDANHTGVLATETGVASYISRCGSPTLRFGFASVWLVGPTTDLCVRLGKGIL